MRSFLLIAVVVTAPIQSLARTDDTAALFERVFTAQDARQRRQGEFAFRETGLTEHVRNDGTVSKAESRTFLVTPGPSGEYRRLVAKDGEPLSPKAETKEEKKLQNHVKKQQRLSSKERREQRKKLERRLKRYKKRLRQAWEAFDFTPLPDDDLEGRAVRVFHFEPKQGYSGHDRFTKMLAKLEGTVWIDAERAQIARIHLRLREDMKLLAGLFGKIGEGSEALAEGWPHEDVWLLDKVELNLKARLYFVMRYDRRLVWNYTDYEEFSVRTEERIGPRRTSSSRR